jgi:hypothetical protein
MLRFFEAVPYGGDLYIYSSTLFIIGMTSAVTFLIIWRRVFLAIWRTLYGLVGSLNAAGMPYKAAPVTATASAVCFLSRSPRRHD